MAPAAEAARQAEMARLGARARLLRERAGVTQVDVAAALGVDRTTVFRFEAGRNDLGSSRINALAQVLGVEPGDFWA